MTTNDNVDLRLKLNATGVHLGQLDVDAREAIYALGINRIIGLSVNNIEQVKNSNRLLIDYIGVGAIFPTLSKPDVENIWDLDGIRQISQISSSPIIAVGGINKNNVLFIINAGASRIVAIGGIQ